MICDIRRTLSFGYEVTLELMDEIARRLKAYYERSLPIRADVKVHELEMLASSWESDPYAFTLEHGPAAKRAREKLVLRLYSGSGAREKSAHEPQRLPDPVKEQSPEHVGHLLGRIGRPLLQPPGEQTKQRTSQKVGHHLERE